MDAAPAPAPALAALTARLASRGITAPTPIQRLTAQPLLEGKSLLFQAPTGTGKTLAYLLPLLARRAKPEAPAGGAADPRSRTGGAAPHTPRWGAEGPPDPPLWDLPGGYGPPVNPITGGLGGPRPPSGGTGAAPPFLGPGSVTPRLGLLVLAPTYELCSQIKGELDFLVPGGSALFIGAVNLERQVEVLKKEKPGIVVGNPGRLLLLAKMGKLRLGGLEALVLDEADRLVSDELYPETKALLERLPRDIQVIGCSATLPPVSLERVRGALGVEIPLLEDKGEDVLRDKITHWAVFSPWGERIITLAAFIAASERASRKVPPRMLIFTSRGGEVQNIAARLRERKLPAGALWGSMGNKERKKALGDFREGRLRYLVTTDLAARGLDIPGLSHVAALDTGEGAVSYLHRAGRTGRAGREGIMVTIGDAGEMRRLAAIEKRLGLTVYPKDLRDGRVVPCGG